MKIYTTPKFEFQAMDSHDIVCGSSGVSIGNGGSDIENWEWNLPAASTINLTKTGEN